MLAGLNSPTAADWAIYPLAYSTRPLLLKGSAGDRKKVGPSEQWAAAYGPEDQQEQPRL